MPSRARGVAALVLAGLLFGSTFLVVQGAVERVAVVPFLALRFLIAGAVLWPIARRRAATPQELRHGVLAGSSLLAGYLLQTIGLRTVTAATSAFITYLLIVIVPILTAMRSRRMPGGSVFIAVGLALAGLYALSGGPASFGSGEMLTLLGAGCFAIHIVIVGEVSGHHDPVRLTMWQVLTVGVACAVASPFTGGLTGMDLGVLGAAVFTGVGATALAFWCMTWAQQVVPGPQAALILLLEPVTAGLLGEVVGDHLGRRGLLGAALILAAVIVAELGGRRLPAVGGELVVVSDPTGPGRPSVPPDQCGPTDVG